MRIAHLSDVHILDPRARARRAGYKVAARIVGMGRAVDPWRRSRRLARALALAREKGADHVVISGDLTEVGEQVEFEHFAEVLEDARLPEGTVTLVPGNHDAYTPGNAWSRAMAGPLARFAAASAPRAGEPPTVVDRGPVAFLPIDTTVYETKAWSGGSFTRRTAELLERRLRDPAFANKALVLVVHHPPFHPHALPIVRWIDGLRGAADMLELLRRHPRLQLLHGHLHRVLDRMLTLTTMATSGAALASTAPPERGRERETRLFGAPATCDGAADDPEIRLYDVCDGRIVAA